MYIINKNTGIKRKIVIEQLNQTDILALKNHEQFTFEWNLEGENDVYKLRLKEQEEILGLLSIMDYPKEFRVHINLVESAKQHRGKHKVYEHIPGCLIAFACRLAFIKGYDGFVSLVPKTALINYYHQTYGFLIFGNQMAVYGMSANFIIKKYLGDE